MDIKQCLMRFELTLDQAGCNMCSIHWLNIVNICGKLFQNNLKSYGADTTCNGQTERQTY